MPKPAEFLSLLREAFDEWNKDNAVRLAAALAYFTVFSIAPLLIVIIAIAGAVLGQNDVQMRLQAQIADLIGQQGAETISATIDAIRQPSESIPATLIGIGTLLLGAAGLFGQLQGALNTVWGVVPAPNANLLFTIRQRFLSFAMVLGVGFLLLVSLVINTVLAGLQAFLLSMFPAGGLLLQATNFVVSITVITLLFAMIYKVLPDVEIRWRDVWVGAAFTALLFSLGKFLIGQYLGRSGVASPYGAAGSLVLILLWVFYSAQILLYGAEFTQVYARRYGRIQPARGAMLSSDLRAQQKSQPQEAPDAAKAPGHIPFAPVAPAAPETAARQQRLPDVVIALGATLVSFVIGVFIGTRGEQ